MNREEQIAHAREVDTEVARLYGEYHEVHDEIVRLRKYIADQRKYAAKPYNQRERDQQMYADRIDLANVKIAKLEPEATARRRKAVSFDVANYGGWNRFFLVQHIHNSMYCSSFRPTTRVGWLPDVSGLTEAEAVAEHGETLCTKCFPDAPVALTTPKADPNACAGSGQYIPHAETINQRGKYAECRHCHEIVYRTPGTGKLRKHKTKGA